MTVCADGGDEAEWNEASMVRAVFLLLVVVGSLAACAGEYRQNALVRSENSTSDDAMAKGYNLVFSVIDVETDGSGQTSVVVKLRNSNMVITNGKLARSKVELQYNTSNSSDPKKFTTIKKLSLNRGTATFRVRLPIGRAQVKAIADIDEGSTIETVSGIFEVLPAPQEDQEYDEDT